MATPRLLLEPASWLGRIGERQLRLNEACNGDAAVEMASPKLENLEGEDSGGGAILCGFGVMQGGREWKRGAGEQVLEATCSQREGLADLDTTEHYVCRVLEFQKGLTDRKSIDL